MDNEAIVTSWIACWATEDVEMTLLHLHEHIIYKVHASSEVLPFGGEKRGRDDLRNLMFDVLANFDVLEYSLKFIRVVGNGARAHVRYIYRHRATGEVLEDTRSPISRTALSDVSTPSTMTAWSRRSCA